MCVCVCVCVCVCMCIYICTMETGRYLVKKQVFRTSFACVAFSREYFD